MCCTQGTTNQEHFTNYLQFEEALRSHRHKILRTHLYQSNLANNTPLLARDGTCGPPHIISGNCKS